jgi:hypothetical protein
MRHEALRYIPEIRGILFTTKAFLGWAALESQTQTG